MIVSGIVIQNGWWVGGWNQGGSVNPNMGQHSNPTSPSISVGDPTPSRTVIVGSVLAGPDDVGHDINPWFGAAFFFLAGALRLHPATATAGFIIGVGAAVINYGAGRAGAEAPSGGGGAF